MLNINFVPDDYIQKRESMRANLMCLILFVLVMAGLGGAFMVLKMRQRAISQQSAIVSSKMEEAKKDIAKLEELQAERKSIMKAALTTAELIEPIPRTVLLAELTNTLPEAVSLQMVKVAEKEMPMPPAPKPVDGAAPSPPREPERETLIEIEGLAPSDIELAGYIAQLNNSTMLDNVALVQSKEHLDRDKKEKQEEQVPCREFRLTARLKTNVHLSQKDIERIRSKRM